MATGIIVGIKRCFPQSTVAAVDEDADSSDNEQESQFQPLSAAPSSQQTDESQLPSAKAMTTSKEEELTV